MSEGFTPAVARRVTGVTQRCLGYWAERGVVVPSVQAANGKGTLRLYSFRDLLKLAVVKRLRETGLSLQRIRDGLAHLQFDSPSDDPMVGELLVSDGSGLFRVVNPQTAEDLHTGQLVFSAVALGALGEQLKGDVAEIRKNPLRHRGRPGQGRKERVA